ncbi:phosphoribosylanthranilate isomerase [Dorea sp. AF36-15AT]|uniref:phosphoribosylanthranilate isomerase n=1 Tax=Dorea sp. AF36-15AT TaxID=2292041 RepID=UPI000E4DC729|nr:phosphoribosylanthranilate isomerase [Dorea sp. AF36-15AT]RHP08888.1 phosphoribosylanthranilate isomerase [Dorea sp. AF36-15AT]
MKIKLCGLTRPCDIEAVNELQPDYIGFVFAKKSRRYVSPEKAEELKAMLAPGIQAVGVFVNEEPEQIVSLLEAGTIDVAQLHGQEGEREIRRLRELTDHPLIQAFRIDTEQDVERANDSTADYVLLDSGAGGTGTVFDWDLLQAIRRPYFLAGGLDTENLGTVKAKLNPYGIDVSSGIETDGYKDKEKMTAFVAAARKEDAL